MSFEIISKNEVGRLTVIDERGSADEALLPALTDDEHRRIFETLLLVRAFNKTALNLQREGRMGTYPSVFGQEASQVASAIAFSNDDWLVPSFRETGVYIAKGMPMWMLIRYWMGDERGMRCPDDLNILPMAVPVGSQIVHGAGIAMAMKCRGDKRAVGIYFGDGASSRGDFHEGLNFAGVFKVPAVFMCQNNQWAISHPRARQSAGVNFAMRAASYGIDGVQVDGNDVIAVRHAMDQALAKARSGGGPTLIEAVTYRLADHTTADDASRYRSPDELAAAWKLEPVLRLRTYLTENGAWDKAREDALLKDCNEQVQAAAQAYLDTPPPEPGQMFDHLYATLPAALQRQRAAALGGDE